jgi:N utilization substance protein B
MGSRRKSREYALQLLFQSDFSETSGEDDLFWAGRSADEETQDFARILYRSYVDNQESVDGLIQRHSKHWRIERIATVDRNILRMAISEFLASTTPCAVVINEAIEIARKYSGEESTEFVNGVLDAVAVSLTERDS